MGCNFAQIALNYSNYDIEMHIRAMQKGLQSVSLAAGPVLQASKSYSGPVKSSRKVPGFISDLTPSCSEQGQIQEFSTGGAAYHCT